MAPSRAHPTGYRLQTNDRHASSPAPEINSPVTERVYGRHSPGFQQPHDRLAGLSPGQQAYTKPLARPASASLFLKRGGSAS
jgi:hypothetical protein